MYSPFDKGLYPEECFPKEIPIQQSNWGILGLRLLGDDNEMKRNAAAEGRGAEDFWFGYCRLYNLRPYYPTTLLPYYPITLLPLLE